MNRKKRALERQIAELESRVEGYSQELFQVNKAIAVIDRLPSEAMEKQLRQLAKLRIKQSTVDGKRSRCEIRLGVLKRRLESA